MKKLSLVTVAALMAGSAYAKIGDIDYQADAGKMYYEANVGMTAFTTDVDVLGTTMEYKVNTMFTAHSFSYGVTKELEVGATLAYSSSKTEVDGTEADGKDAGLNDIELNAAYALPHGLTVGAVLGISPGDAESDEDGNKDGNAYSGGHWLTFSLTYDYKLNDALKLQAEAAYNYRMEATSVELSDDSESKTKATADYGVSFKAQYDLNEAVAVTAGLGYLINGEEEDKDSGEKEESYSTTFANIGAIYHISSDMYVGAEFEYGMNEDKNNRKDTTSNTGLLKFGMNF